MAQLRLSGLDQAAAVRDFPQHSVCQQFLRLIFHPQVTQAGGKAALLNKLRQRLHPGQSQLLICFPLAGNIPDVDRESGKLLRAV